MTTLLPALAVAFAAFCVWLTVRNRAVSFRTQNRIGCQTLKSAHLSEMLS
jgi:hypothetical protein